MIRGVICPLTEEPVDRGECLACSLENKEKYEQCGWDTMVLAQIMHSRQVSGLSMSELMTDFIRKTLFSKLIDYYVEPSKGYYAVRGTWVHEGMRRVYLNPDFGELVREKRLTLPGTSITGQVDCYYGACNRLVDYKSTSRMLDHPRPSHVRQLNGYVELLRANGYKVDDAYISYLSYSQHQRVPVPVWERERTQELLTDTIQFFQQCMDNREVPPRDLCAGPDRWFMCRYCAFQDICADHPDWWTVPEGAVNIIGGSDG